MSAATNRYPFMTKAEIRARLNNDDAFTRECFGILQARYEARLRGETLKGSAGWMVSDARAATRLAAKIGDGTETGTEKKEAARLAGRYAKQLAVHFREVDLALNPALEAAAAVFGLAAASRQPSAADVDIPAEECGAPGALVTGQVDAKASAPAPGEEPGSPSKAVGRRPTERSLRARVSAFLAKHDGSKAAAIASALGVEVADVSPLLRELVAEGAVTRNGVGRGTTYSLQRR